MVQTLLRNVKEIKIIIEDIQRASEKLISASEKGTKQINTSWENAKSLEKGFGNIMDSSNENKTSNEIKDKVGQVASSGGKIFNTLHQISRGIEKFSQDGSPNTAQ